MPNGTWLSSPRRARIYGQDTGKSSAALCLHFKCSESIARNLIPTTSAHLHAGLLRRHVAVKAKATASRQALIPGQSRHPRSLEIGKTGFMDQDSPGCHQDLSASEVTGTQQSSRSKLFPTSHPSNEPGNHCRVTEALCKSLAAGFPVPAGHLVPSVLRKRRSPTNTRIAVPDPSSCRNSASNRRPASGRETCLYLPMPSCY